MVYDIIKAIKATRSRNEKESIITQNSDNENLKNFFRLALNPFINYYQKKPINFKRQDAPHKTIEDAYQFLEDRIATRKVTGNAAIAEIKQLLESLSDDDSMVVNHILQKESGCDTGGATVNKIWPKLIPKYPCLLATEFTEKLANKLNWVAGVYSQLKADGLRVNLIIDEYGGVTAFSRAGNPLNFFGAFDFLGDHFRSVVLDGELLTVKENGKFNNRQTSNGICSKAIRGTMSEDEANTLHFIAWDAIPLEDFKREKSQLTYKERFTNLTYFLTLVQENNKISLIPSKIVHSLEQAREHYNTLRAMDEEGSMIKDASMPWEDTRSKLQLKLKANLIGDFEVIGYKDGVGELTGNLGSLEIASSDRKVVTSMSGFPMKLRSEIYANLTDNPVSYTMVVDDQEKVFVANPGDTEIDIASIIECKYNMLTLARDTNVWSVFLPRFEKVRLDKQVANTFEELPKQ